MEKKKSILIVAFLIILPIIVFEFFYLTQETKNTIPIESGDTTVFQTATTTVANTAPKNIPASNQYLAQDGVYVVRYTDKGFVPEQLQIPKGKTVRFVNLSTKGMRIFSDSTSLQFLELNQSKTVGKGETYTFSFVNTGLWSYYNQANTAHKASIVVY